MKFLENVRPDQEVQPLNYIYFNGRNFEEDDVLSVVYKDVASGKIIVQNISKPMVELWLVKPEYRDKVTYIHHYLPKEWMYPKKFHYRSRFSEVAKELGLNSPDDAKRSPWVSMIDMDIRRYYAVQFLLEYKIPQIKKINIGYFDIESDIVEIAPRFPEPGEVPISCMTFIDGSAKAVYTFILEPESHATRINPDTGDYYDYRDQVRYVKEHQEEFLQEIHDTFDETYPGFDYNLIFEKEEVELIRHFFQVVELSNVDFALAWNIAYDMAHLTARPRVLGADPAQVCCSKKFKVWECQFTEDRNPLAHKRRHMVQLSHPTVFLDQMVIYAGIRSAQGVQASLKLNAIGQKVIGDTKINYEEAGNLTNLLYSNFRKYVIYNIKDVLLQWGIENKLHDMNDIYNRMTTDGLLPFEIFTSTQMLTNSLTKDFLLDGYCIGINKNKLTADQYNVAEYNMSEEDDEESAPNPDGEVEDLYEESTKASEFDTGGDIGLLPMNGVIGRRSEKGFEGAMVQNPNRMIGKGKTINGVPNSKVQEHCADEDYSAMYPNIMLFQNLSAESLIGRVEFEDVMYDYFALLKGEQFCESRRVGSRYMWTQSDFTLFLYHSLPMHNYDFIGQDAKSYKLNTSDNFLSFISQDCITQMGQIYMNLPSAEELVDSGEFKPKFKG